MRDGSDERHIAETAWQDAASDPNPVTDPFVTMPLDANDIEVYQLFASEMFDPSIFENNAYGTTAWDGAMC